MAMESTAVPPPEHLRALQEQELRAVHSLAAMEHALGEEASRVVVALRETGLELDPLDVVQLVSAVARRVTGTSDRTLPLNVSASSSNPVLPDSMMRTLPEWEVNS